MAGRGADEGRRKLPGSGRAQAPRRAPGSTVPGTEIAAMERREAPAFSKGNAAYGRTGAPLGAPSPSACAGGSVQGPAKRGSDDGVPGAGQEYGRRSVGFFFTSPRKRGEGKKQRFANFSPTTTMRGITTTPVS